MDRWIAYKFGVSLNLLRPVKPYPEVRGGKVRKSQEQVDREREQRQERKLRKQSAQGRDA